MRLAGIHLRDIVKADGTYWWVVGREGRMLICAHMQSRSTRRFRGAEIQQHWRHRAEQDALRPVPGPSEGVS